MDNDIQLSLSHIGYRPDSPKTVTMTARSPSGIPEEVPFYIRQNCIRMPRDIGVEDGFSSRFPYPYDLLRGKLIPQPGTFFYKGLLRRKDTRWGSVWQGSFDDFRTPGSYQIETDDQVSAPFMLADWIYDRLALGFLTFMNAQRCGCEIPGIHPACHLDDGILDTDGQPWLAVGGWHDAGDFRKNLALIQGNLEALAIIAERGHRAFRSRALDEIRWGNRLFHDMITKEGRVFEDVGAGSRPAGMDFSYEKDWWFENHAGSYSDASDNRWTDNRLGSGDERKLRTTYNPQKEFMGSSTKKAAMRRIEASAPPDSRPGHCFV